MRYYMVGQIEVNSLTEKGVENCFYKGTIVDLNLYKFDVRNEAFKKCSYLNNKKQNNNYEFVVFEMFGGLVSVYKENQIIISRFVLNLKQDVNFLPEYPTPDSMKDGYIGYKTALGSELYNICCSFDYTEDGKGKYLLFELQPLRFSGMFPNRLNVTGINLSDQCYLYEDYICSNKCLDLNVKLSSKVLQKAILYSNESTRQYLPYFIILQRPDSIAINDIYEWKKILNFTKYCPRGVVVKTNGAKGSGNKFFHSYSRWYWEDLYNYLKYDVPILLDKQENIRSRWVLIEAIDMPVADKYTAKGYFDKQRNAKLQKNHYNNEIIDSDEILYPGVYKRVVVGYNIRDKVFHYVLKGFKSVMANVYSCTDDHSYFANHQIMEVGYWSTRPPEINDIKSSAKFLSNTNYRTFLSSICDTVYNFCSKFKIGMPVYEGNSESFKYKKYGMNIVLELTMSDNINFNKEIFLTENDFSNFKNAYCLD